MVLSEVDGEARLERRRWEPTDVRVLSIDVKSDCFDLEFLAFASSCAGGRQEGVI